MSKSFRSWSNYFGLLYEDLGSPMPSRVFGFCGAAAGDDPTAEIPAEGACYGFVSAGRVKLDVPDREPVRLYAGQWFTTPTGCDLTVATSDVSVFVAQRIGYRGIFSIGGPIEERGRLRYIDGCTDSLLAPPPLRGDPCLNHLHFPSGIDQTQHTHPSLRAGIIARGRGYCDTPDGTTELVPNLIFVIPTDGVHKFRTEPGVSMDVVPYHPDSDWGPTHEEHPMVNRTLVGGQKIDNTKGVHVTADVLMAFQP